MLVLAAARLTMRDPMLPRRRFEVDWALVALLAAVAWGVVIGCSLTGCHRVEVPAHADSGAAPAAPSIPHANADECPGGMCAMPPPLSPKQPRRK